MKIPKIYFYVLGAAAQNTEGPISQCGGLKYLNILSMASPLSPLSPFSPFGPFSPFSALELLFDSLSTNLKMTNFHLHN